MKGRKGRVGKIFAFILVVLVVILLIFLIKNGWDMGAAAKDMLGIFNSQ
jgi:hypothetical protein